jgi:hypothetical protein
MDKYKAVSIDTHANARNLHCRNSCQAFPSTLAFDAVLSTHLAPMLANPGFRALQSLGDPQFRLVFFFPSSQAAFLRVGPGHTPAQAAAREGRRHRGEG